MSDDEEVAFLRNIAQNPYDQAIRGAYADWLAEQGRAGDEAAIRRTFGVTGPPSANWITVGELIGKLLTMPLETVCVYRACSDWNMLQPDDVKFVPAEKKLVNYRDESGYTVYESSWFDPPPNEPRSFYQRDTGRAYGEQPKFVDVCTFPGN
jgi:uncharacterized protein (TIGR02996 family)